MSSARAVRRPRVVVGTLGILLTLTTASACALLPDDSGGPSSGGAAPGAATPTASDDGSTDAPSEREPVDAATIRSAGTAVPLGRSTVWILVTDDDGAAAQEPTVTVLAPDTGASDDPAATGARSEITIGDVPTTTDSGRAGVHLAGPEGTAPERLLDGSLVFRDADDVAVAGADAPVGRVEGGSAAYYEMDDDHAAVVVPPDDGIALGTESALGNGLTADDESASNGPTGPVELTLRFSASAVVSATWGENEGGRSLAVVPNEWLRAGSLAAQEVGWSQLVARDAEVDTSTMRNQYDCHALGARDKASWNLEPWRPDVGVFEVLAARCNPT